MKLFVLGNGAFHLRHKHLCRYKRPPDQLNTCGYRKELQLQVTSERDACDDRRRGLSVRGTEHIETNADCRSLTGGRLQPWVPGAVSFSRAFSREISRTPGL